MELINCNISGEEHCLRIQRKIDLFLIMYIIVPEVKRKVKNEEFTKEIYHVYVVYYDSIIYGNRFIPTSLC